MRKIIVSVGTSLLTNLEDSTNRPWRGWKTGDLLPNVEDMKRYIRNADQTFASAETNTLEKLGLQAGDYIYWLHSDTEEGKLCAEALKLAYEDKGVSGELREIPGIKYHSRTLAEYGLKSLVDVVVSIIRKARKDSTEICICATGGFKVEMAYLTLIGILLNCNVYYIHEMFKELVTIPALPIKWDFSVIETNISLFERMSSGNPARQEVENWLKAAPELQPLVLFEEDSAFLSAAGDLLYEAYKEEKGISDVEYPEKSKRQPSEKILLSSDAHHRPKGLEKFAERLSKIDYVDLIRYESANPSSSENRIIIANPEKGEFKVVYSSDYSVSLSVETTARGEKQCELIKPFIKEALNS